MKKVLILGASGFIGARLTELLVSEFEIPTRVLVRHFGRAVALARMPLEVECGDVLEAESLIKAAEGVDVIVNCAVSFSGNDCSRKAVIVQGARNALAAARSHGAHLIHISTISVYGPGPGESLDEETPRKAVTQYGRNKKIAEQEMIAEARSGSSVTIIQPTIVYGPRSFWSSHVIRQNRAGKVALPNDGSGICNAVYVDDVVGAIVSAIKAGRATAGPYLVSGRERVTWRQFYEAHSVDGAATIVPLESAEIDELRRSTGFARRLHSAVPAVSYHLKKAAAAFPGVRPLIESVAPALARRPALPDHMAGGNVGDKVLPSPEHLDDFLERRLVRVARAEKEIGYCAAVDLREGVGMTRLWAKWAGLFGGGQVFSSGLVA